MTEYQRMEKKLKGKQLPWTGISNDGENVLYQRGRSDAGRFYQVSTIQSNGWMRINTYYEDGTQDETYKK